MIKLLSIDDQRDNQITIKGALSSYFKGADFYFALSGKDGIRIANEANPDIILLDIMMPEMDGFETCRLIKADSKLKYIPVILLSAIGSKTENRIKGMEMGADAVMSKPFDPGELAAQIRVMLRIKTAEEKLRQENIMLDKLVEEKISEIVYQATVLESVSDAVISADTQFIIKSWNDAAEKTYGWNESEVIGKPYSEVLRPVYPEHSRDEVVEYFTAHGRYTSEVLHHHKDGSVLSILTSVTRLLDNNSQNIGTVALNRDITKEKASEKEIHNLTTRLELAVKAVELGIWEWDLETNEFNWNEEFGAMYGILESAPQVPLEMLEKYLFKEDFLSTQRHLRNLVRTGNKIVLEHRIHNPLSGSHTVISKAVRLTDNTGKAVKIVGVSYDITQRRQMEAKLKQSEERYRLLIETSNDLVWITDEQGCFLFYNQHVEEVTGYAFEQYMGKSYEFLFPEKSRAYMLQEYDKVLAGQKSQIEIDVIFAGGVEHKLWINMAPIYDKDKVVSVATFARDMSDYYLAMEELKLALSKAKESDRLKSAFLATMSHELRTPLNAIIGFSSLLTRDMEADEFQKFADIIGDSGQHLLSLVEEIFDVTLIESGEVKINKESFDITPVYEKVKEFGLKQQSLFKRESIEIIFDDLSNVAPLKVYSDMRRLEQIWEYLLKNAFKFTESGTIKVGVKRVVENDKPTLQFYISDTGIGVPADKQEMIFESFRQADDSHTRKYDGVGLGLSLAKKLAVLMGGNINLISKEGVGSTFTLVIPDVSHEKTHAFPSKSKGEVSFDGKTVLIVEDDIDSFHLLELVLLRHGAVPVWAHNGKEAVDYCTQNELPWMVLMDLNMPVLNGIDATRQLKAAFPDLTIIAQTAFTIREDVNRAIEAGCDDVISKPIMINKLILLMNKYQNPTINF